MNMDDLICCSFGIGVVCAVIFLFTDSILAGIGMLGVPLSLVLFVV